MSKIRFDDDAKHGAVRWAVREERQRLFSVWVVEILSIARHVPVFHRENVLKIDVVERQLSVLVNHRRDHRQARLVTIVKDPEDRLPIGSFHLLQRLDALSIPHYVIKKGRPHGARHGKTEEQKEHFVAHNARRRCLRKKFEGIHDCVLKDSTYRDSHADHVRTGRPVESKQSIGLITQCEEIDIDFRVSGLPHAVVKQAENFRVRELVKKIESHPHRRALQADLQQNNAYNPFGDESKAIICEMGNVELFELCETIPIVQCSGCLLSWNQGVIYCKCGHLFVESESSQKSHTLRLDALSIPHYVIKKGRPHGARHGKTEEQKEYHTAFNAWKRCRKRVDAQEEHYKGIHDRFLRDQVYRESQLKIGWTEKKCIEMDELAQQDHTYRLLRADATSIRLSSCSLNQKPSPS